MAGANERQAVEAWLFGKLTGYSTLNTAVGGRVYAGAAPESAVQPFLLYAYNASHPYHAVGSASRVLNRFSYVVRAYTVGTSTAPADVLARYIDEAISGSTGFVTVDSLQYYIHGCRLVQFLAGVETGAGGKRYNGVGGIYDLLIQRQA